MNNEGFQHVMLVKRSEKISIIDRVLKGRLFDKCSGDQPSELTVGCVRVVLCLM